MDANDSLAALILKAGEGLAANNAPMPFLIHPVIYDAAFGKGVNIPGYVRSGKLPPFDGEGPTATTEGVRMVLEGLAVVPSNNRD